MGLQNLVGISLEQITPARETIKRLLDAAARHIADAKVNAISAETRFAGRLVCNRAGTRRLIELVFQASRDERRVYEEAMKVIPQSAALYRAAVRDLNSTLRDPTERA